MKLHATLGSVALLALGVTASAAQAQEGDIQDQIDLLKKQIAALEKKIAQAPIIKKAEPAPVIGSADGLHEMNLRGRIMMDFGWASGASGNVNVDAAEMRAAWLGIEGKAYGKVKYKFDADFGSNTVAIKDAYLQIGGATKFTVGHIKQPNTTEYLVAAHQVTSLERSSLVTGFGIGRGMGATIGHSGKNWSITGGMFRGTAKSTSDDEGLILSARGTYGGTFKNATYMFGASYRHRDMGDSLINYKARPGHHLTPISEGVKANGTHKDSFMGLEFAAQSGPFHFGSEWGTLEAKNADAGKHATFDAGYIEVGYFITGEAKPLNLKKGAWGRPKVNNRFLDGGSGAWQVIGKYDTIDLNDGTIAGGKMDTYILGLNWYLNPYTRFVVNYSTSDVSAPDIHKNIDALGLRFQVDW